MPPSQLTEQDNLWTSHFTVRSYECDATRRATIQTLCNYFQETAWLHATHLGFALADQQDSTKTWVLLRLRVRMQDFPVWGDPVVVTTWPSGKDRLYAYRDFKVHDERGQLLAAATSSWIIIDIHKRRPQRMPDTLERSIPKNKPRALLLPDEPPARNLPDPMETEMPFQVRLSDIDVNNHVNNVNFIEWAIEAVPPSWRNANQLSELDVTFKAESNYGECIVSQFAAIREQQEAVHRVYRPEDEKTLILATTQWKAKS